MLKTTTNALVLQFLALCFTASVFAEEETTMYEVCLASRRKINEAQSMMGKVLRGHLNSAKAYFVESNYRQTKVYSGTEQAKD